MSFVPTDSLNIYETINLSSSQLRQQLGTDLAAPSIFHGIKVNTFGNSRKNPFFKIKAIAMDPSISKEDRMMAVRYMCSIPHKDKLPNTIEAACSILNDERYPIGERYFFFSNNEKNIKLDDHIVRACHIYFFQYAKPSNDKQARCPVVLRLLSAQYIYMNISHNTPEWEEARTFILTIALDQEETVRLRSEAADILCRKVDLNDASVGRDVIRELGDLYNDNKFKTIYTNAQNAHNETITESVMEVVRNLAATRPKVIEDSPTGFSDIAEHKTSVGRNTGEIYEKIIKLTEQFEPQRKAKIHSAFNFVLIYPAKYETLCLSDILVLVWERICSQPDNIRKELENRLLEELYEMDETCGTGLLTRIVNILSGYTDDDNLQIRMSINDQLRSNIFARLGTNMRFLPESQQDEILTEISSDNSSKKLAKEFVESYSVYEELKEEFVASQNTTSTIKKNLLSIKQFDEIYKKCIADFLGLSS